MKNVGLMRGTTTRLVMIVTNLLVYHKYLSLFLILYILASLSFRSLTTIRSD